jgi:hypothetical protein
MIGEQCEEVAKVFNHKFDISMMMAKIGGIPERILCLPTSACPNWWASLLVVSASFVGLYENLKIPRWCFLMQ